VNLKSIVLLKYSMNLKSSVLLINVSGESLEDDITYYFIFFFLSYI